MKFKEHSMFLEYIRVSVHDNVNLACRIYTVSWEQSQPSKWANIDYVPFDLGVSEIVDSNLGILERSWYSIYP